MRKIGSKDDFEEGRPNLVTVGGLSVVVCRVGDEFYALENRCSHDDEELGSGELKGCELVCPRHGARFDIRDGTVTVPPAISPIETYDIEVRHGNVYLDSDN